MGARSLTLLLLTFLLAALPATAGTGAENREPEGGVTIHFFWAANCPHCAEARPFLEELAATDPRIRLAPYEIWNNRENFERLQTLVKRAGGKSFSTPAIAVGEGLWFGFTPGIAAAVEETVRACLAANCPDPLAAPRQAPPRPASAAPPPLDLPLLGPVAPERFSLPVLAIVLGLLDSFNPCAFFVLLFLLSLLVHARSRRLMLLVGGVFVLCSGVIYFLFMAAWLELFRLVGHLPLITRAAGGLALVIGLLNVKDFFLFRQGPSLSIPESAKPGLFSRMRGLLRENRLPPLLAGTLVLAVVANSYELLCTAGFPMAFTRILTLHRLEGWAYYGYLALYNGVYVLPLLTIVVLFVWKLGSRKLSEGEGRAMKLLSGTMMLLLGGVLVAAPELLQNPLVAVGLLVAALVLTGAALALRRATGRRS